jgi:hypothetical protein
LAIAGACAVGVNGTGDAGSGSDATTGDAGACPQFDLQTDPAHCGSCTNACPTGQVCSSGKCTTSCQSPTTKCVVDAGSLCLTLSSDPNHCGQCNTVCSAGDAGGLEAGTNNPDSGIPPGYDSGTGWTLGTPSCDASTCAVVCPSGTTNCNGICFDTQNFHDNCGSCGTACQSTEWCNSGHCCAQGTEWCGSSCVDVHTDPANCGTCGKACSGGTPYCSQGTCTAGCTPTGTRQAFNTMSSHTTSGCWDTGNPCQLDAYNFSQTYGENFQANGQQITCGGTTACIGHVGIDTYGSSGTVCQGSWDVYCNATKVGSINTINKTSCIGSAMTNGCSTSFTPTTCTTIELVATAGSGTQNCCAGSAPDSMIVGVSAW